MPARREVEGPRAANTRADIATARFAAAGHAQASRRTSARAIADLRVNEAVALGGAGAPTSRRRNQELGSRSRLFPPAMARIRWKQAKRGFKVSQ